MNNEELVYFTYNKLNKTDMVIREKNDLIQEGFIGLIKAENTFNPELKISFSNYAITCIKNQMTNYLKKNNKYEYNLSLQSKLDDNLELVDTIKDKLNIEEEMTSNAIINDLLNSNELTAEEIKIIKLFMKGYSRSSIKKQFNINDSYLYSLFIKLNAIIYG